MSEEKWRRHLPVVYVPKGEEEYLIDVLYEVVEVDNALVIFLWFHWTHDKPTSLKPEYEPLSIVVCRGYPRRLFSRPHYMHKIARPILQGRRPVVYISEIGHAPKTSRHEVLRASYSTKYRRLPDETLVAKLKPGDPPPNFRKMAGIDFREWVLSWVGPETAKSICGNDRLVLRYFWHLLKAALAAGRGDLQSVRKNMIKGYLSLPSTLKMCPVILYLLREALSYQLGYELTEHQRRRLKAYYLSVMLELPIDILYFALHLRDKDFQQQKEGILEYMRDEIRAAKTMNNTS